MINKHKAKDMILEALQDGPKTRKQLVALLAGRACDTNVMAAVLSLVVSGQIFEGEKRNGGCLLGLQPFVRLEQRIIDLLSEGDLSGIAITRKLGEHNSVVQARLLLLRDRRIIKPMGDAQNRTWRLIGQPDHEVMLMSDQEAQQLRQLVAQQWRGTPWQGLEVVL